MITLTSNNIGTAFSTKRLAVKVMRLEHAMLSLPEPE